MLSYIKYYKLIVFEITWELIINCEDSSFIKYCKCLQREIKKYNSKNPTIFWSILPFQKILAR